MKVILLLVLAVPVTPFYFTPHLKLPLYGEDVYNLICKTGLNSTIIGLERYGDRLYGHINSTHYPLLRKCWKEIIGIDYPSYREDWVTFYCNNTSPWIPKNLAEHCFISSWKKKVDFSNFEDTTDYYIDFDLDDEDWEGVGSEMQTVLHDEDYYSDKRCNNITDNYDKTNCVQKIAQENLVRKVCVENDTKAIQEAIHQHKCMERAASAKMKILNFCWNIIIKKAYPANDEEWKDLTCKMSFPFAKKRLIGDCMINRMARENQYDHTIFRADCEGSYFPPEDEGYYSRHTYEENVANVMKLIDLEKDYKSICEDKDASKTENFLKHNELKCLKDSVETPLGLKVLSYCWNRSFGKNNVSLPSEKGKWLSFACSDNAIKILRTGEEVVSCFKNLINAGENRYDDDSPVTSIEAKISTRCEMHADD